MDTVGYVPENKINTALLAAALVFVGIVLILLTVSASVQLKKTKNEGFDFKYGERQCAWRLIGVGKEINHPDRYWKLQKLNGQNKYRVFPPHMTGSYQVKNTNPIRNGDLLTLTLRPDIKLITKLGPVSNYSPRV